MNKASVLKEILTALQAAHQSALNAADQAHETATHADNVAENKYDTFGLEAAYLAHGQSKRVASCASDLAAYKKLPTANCSTIAPITIGTLIRLMDEQSRCVYIFLGPGAGGLKFQAKLAGESHELTIITASAPLGQALLGKYLDDEFELTIKGEKKFYEIKAIY